MYISTPPLVNQCFSSALQLRKTKLRNRPTGTKNTKIIGDVKKSIVCDSVEIISTVREMFSGRVRRNRQILPLVTQCTIQCHNAI